MSGVPELMILRFLQDREMYGYEIAQAIRLQTREVVHLSEGVLYPVLQRLEKDGALKSRRKDVGGRSRVYYSLTASGARRLTDLTESWATLADAIQAVLKRGAGVRPV